MTDDELTRAVRTPWRDRTPEQTAAVKAWKHQNFENARRLVREGKIPLIRIPD